MNDRDEPHLPGLAHAEGDAAPLPDDVPLPLEAAPAAEADDRLPPLAALLRHAHAETLLTSYGARATRDALRRALDEARSRGRSAPLPHPDELVAAARVDLVARRAGRVRRVINATGVVLPENLGRAPLSAAARAAIIDAAGYCTVGYDAEGGRRGSHTGHAGRLAAEACGAEAAAVVNNGAAAIVLVLAALAAGQEVVVSRGELVEIGGSFRLPDVVTASGALLREVGTTNRTDLDDYRTALGDRTGAVLKVHRATYAMVGASSEPPLRDIAEVVHAAGLPLVHDIGAGVLRHSDDLEPSDRAAVAPFAAHPSAAASLRSGADLVIFSTDKLLGGPQAGVIAGRSDLVLRCERHPLARALRLDKLRRAALEVTLESHLRADVPLDIPVWAMLTADGERLQTRAEAIAAAVGWPVRAAAAVSLTGGGSLPGAELASWAVIVEAADPDVVARALRDEDPPVIARIEARQVVLDLRTVAPADDDRIIAVLQRALER